MASPSLCSAVSCWETGRFSSCLQTSRLRQKLSRIGPRTERASPDNQIHSISPKQGNNRWAPHWMWGFLVLEMPLWGSTFSSRQWTMSIRGWTMSTKESSLAGLRVFSMRGNSGPAEWTTVSFTGSTHTQPRPHISMHGNITLQNLKKYITESKKCTLSGQPCPLHAQHTSNHTYPCREILLFNYNLKKYITESKKYA